MSGDGFAVKTTIAQMGNVARSQLKSQAVHNTGPEHMKKPGEKERVEKLRETEEAQKSKVDDDQKKNDERNGKKRQSSDEDEATMLDLEDQKETAEEIGLRLDIKA